MNLVRGPLLLFVFAYLFRSGTGVFAETPADPTKVEPGHSHHGEVFNEGPRQRAYLMDKIGRIHFPTSAKSKEAQAFFEQGVCQLHGFWYFEAERSFRQAAMLEPDCAMAYWGMAMANYENKKRAAGFLKKVRDLSCSRREHLYLDSMTELAAGTGDKRKRQERHLEVLKRIIADYPDDVEAKAFYVVRCWQFKMGPPTAELDKILDEVFKINPRHPAHHYRIHIWDNPKPARALGSAALCGGSFPACAHMWHMPGHIYDKLHRYGEAAWQQEASSRADHAYMQRDRVLPDQIHNYAHNQEWLIRSLSNVGRAKDAVALAKNLIELPRHPKYNTLTKAGRSASYGRRRLFEALERYELWDEVLALADTMYLEPTDIPAEQIKRLRLLGLAQAGKGDKEKLAQTIALLQKKSTKDGASASPGPKRQGRGKAKKKPPRRDAAARDNAVKELQMLAKLLDKDNKGALEMLKSLRHLNKTRQARYYLDAGETAKAEELARQASAAGKNQVPPLAVYVETLHAAGKIKECADAFGRLRKISGAIDALDSPLFQRLAPIAQELKLPRDWRLDTPFPSDFGTRPPLESIGPLRWQPTPGPSWSLPDVHGQTIASRQFTGKPTLLIFYLGYGCPHCMQQITKFAAEQKKFQDAGIALVAISTDSREALERSLQTDKPIPFPVASDPKCAAFKAYRAYDDFERQPLHGTFLLDAKGLVRWQDIGYEPFLDTTFVLNEAKRLLALPVGKD